MKAALYFDEQDAQLVLTAESEWEQTILKMMKERIPDIAFMGGFYACQGGWIKHNNSGPSLYSNGSNYTGQSLMIRMPKKGEE